MASTISFPCWLAKVVGGSCAGVGLLGNLWQDQKLHWQSHVKDGGFTGRKTPLTLTVYFPGGTLSQVNVRRKLCNLPRGNLPLLGMYFTFSDTNKCVCVVGEQRVFYLCRHLPITTYSTPDFNVHVSKTSTKYPQGLTLSCITSIKDSICRTNGEGYASIICFINLFVNCEKSITMG